MLFIGFGFDSKQFFIQFTTIFRLVIDRIDKSIFDSIRWRGRFFSRSYRLEDIAYF